MCVGGGAANVAAGVPAIGGMVPSAAAPDVDADAANAVAASVTAAAAAACRLAGRMVAIDSAPSGGAPPALRSSAEDGACGWVAKLLLHKGTAAARVWGRLLLPPTPAAEGGDRSGGRQRRRRRGGFPARRGWHRATRWHES